MLTVILGLCLFGIIVPIYFLGANQRLPKKNIILGVTVPHAHHENPQVGDISAAYIKRLRIFVVTLSVLSLSMFFLPPAAQIMVLLTALTVLIFGELFIYVQAHRALAALKEREGWGGDRPRPASVADLRAMEEMERPIPKMLFFLPCLLNLIPLIPIVVQAVRDFDGLDLDLVFAWALVAVWAPILVILAEVIRRQNAEVVGSISEMNVILTRIRRREYLRCMVIILWFMAILSLGFWFQALVTQSVLIFAPAILILSIILAVYAIRAEFAVRRAQEKFTKIAGDTLEVDDDRHWIWGMFYYNKDDRRLMMKDRIGMNMTMNMARPAGLLIMLISLLLILLMPLAGVWVIAEVETPIHYALEENTVIVTHLRVRQFDLGENWEAELIDQFPHGFRTNGSSIGTLRSGHFNLTGIGPAFVLLNTDDVPLILIRTAERQVYLFNFDPVFAPLLAEEH